MTHQERHQLYLVAWQGPGMAQSWRRPEVLAKLEADGLITKSGAGYEITSMGRTRLSSQAVTACSRPKNYWDLSEDDQWAIDQQLGILDWDGT